MVELEATDVSVGTNAEAAPALPSPTQQHEEGASTPEERLKYLRERGVFVETVSERKQKAEKQKSLAVARASLDPSSAVARTFTYVYIPANSSKPLELRTAVVHADARGEGDQLPNILSPLFSTGKVDEAALHCSPHIKQLSEGAGLSKTLSADSFKRMGGSTETFRLAAGGSGPINDRVNLYLDEIGALKKLPGNHRASALAALCGFGEGVPFFGDMFLGRVRTRRGKILNVDFALEDTRPESVWLRTAAAENRARQQVEAPHRGAGVAAAELREVSGEGKGYSWEQEEEEMLVTVPVPAGTRGKQCKIVITKRSVSVDLKVPSPAFTKVELPLYAAVVAGDSMWSLDGDNIVLTLIKANEDETWPVLTRPTS